MSGNAFTTPGAGGPYSQALSDLVGLAVDAAVVRLQGLTLTNARHGYCQHQKEIEARLQCMQEVGLGYSARSAQRHAVWR